MAREETQDQTVNSDVQRWTTKRKAAVVLDILMGKTPFSSLTLFGLTALPIQSDEFSSTKVQDVVTSTSAMDNNLDVITCAIS